MSIGSIVVDLIANTGTFETDIGRASKAAQKRASEIDKAFSRLGTAIAAAGAAAAVGLSALVKSSIDSADHLNDLSKSSGVSVEALSGLGYAAKQSGSDMDSLAVGMKKLSKAAVDAAQGNKQAVNTFKMLGVSVKNADGSLRSTEDILLDVAEVFSQYEDGAAKAAIAQDLFGKSGTDLIPFLNEGRDGIKELTDEAKELGIVISGETAQAADDFNDNLEKLKTAASGLGAQLSAQLLPSLKNVTDEFVKFIKDADSVDTVASRIDAAFKLVADIGSRVAETFVDVGSALGAIAAAALQAATGHFQEAYEIIKQANEDGKKRDEEYTAFRKKLWEDSGKAVVESAKETSKELTDLESTLGRVFSGLEKQLNGKKQFQIIDTSQIEAAEKAAKKLADEQQRARDSIDSLLTSLRTQIDTYGEGETAVIRYRIAHGDLADEFAKVGGGADQLASQLISLTSQLELMKDSAEAAKDAIADMADVNLEGLEDTLDKVFAPLEEQIKKSVTEISEFQKEAIRNTQDIIGDGIYDAFTGRKNDIIASFTDMINKLVAQALAAQLAEKLFGKDGDGGGWIDTAISAIGGYFGQGKANGGPVSAGSMFRVNEREGEFFRPNVDGKVIPLSKMPTGGGGTVVVNNNIRGDVTTRSANQLAIETARRQRIAAARLG